jgi:predicted phage terminase large subunit-like protein
MKGVDPVTKEQVNRDDYASMLMNPIDNLDNLSSDYIQMLETLPRRQKQRFLNGIFLDDIEGALWTDSMIDDSRVSDYPQFTRKIIAVDPAISYGEDSDETGIIIAAKGIDGHYYILSDISGKYAPGFWGNMVVGTYMKEKCNDIIAEVNQGGELVVQNLRQINPAIGVKRVHASQGKLTRAEPIAALYEQGLVHHVGRFPELEEQMVSYTGKGMKSPDRMDALVWALTDLSEMRVLNYWA